MKRTTKNSPAKKPADNLVISRVFDAPVALVWKAWTDPKEIKKWWGPGGFTAPSIKVDLRVGGQYIFCMRGPKGSPWDKNMYSAGFFKEVIPLKKIVATDYFSDKDGNKIDPSVHGLTGDMPQEMVATTRFETAGKDKTKLTIEYPKPKSKAQLEAMLKSGMEEGWNTSLDKLQASLASALHVIAEPGKQEIVMTRTFDAPRKLVFSAFTDPKLIPEWWGPRSMKTIVDKMDARFGGTWRYIHRMPSGGEYAFRGVYHEITAPETIVDTFEYEGLPGHVMLETVVLEEHDGKTKMINTSVFQSVEDRDGMLHSGMEKGATETMDRFAELLAKLSKDGKRGSKK